MHLLNTLPQRLDPGATPTFAGLIASSLTSPASTNLTLGTGSFGTALTVASATGGATFAGAVTAPNLTLNSTGSKIEANTAGTTQKFLQFSSNGAGVYFGIESSAGDTFFTGSAAYDSVIYTPNNPLFISTTTLKLKGAQTISATTAGSSGAGALIVQGGISAGNTGAASYFGGAATFTGDVSAQRLEAVDAAANNRAAAFFRTQNNTTYSSSVLDIQGDRTTTNATYNLINAQNAAVTGQFSVRDSGNAVNTNNSYGAISDRKLKENIVDATSKLEKLNQVRIVNFNRIGNEQKQLGVIAQELEQIFPSMIEEAIDRDAEGNDLGTTTKSVKYSVFVPMLIKAIQELTTRLAAVEAK